MAKKMYELLAVEQQLKLQAATQLADLKHTFDKKRHHFEAKLKTFTPIEAGAEPIKEEESSIQTTVRSELKWIADLWQKPLDTMLQVEDCNTRARADVVLDNGTTILRDVPATALLQLEKRVGDILGLLKVIPTLDPAKGFTPDTDSGKDRYVARTVTKIRTRKVQKAITLTPTTAEHPGTAQLISVDEPAGRLVEQEWSSMITPTEKGELIERAEEVQRAIKAALHRASAVELAATPPTCAREIFGYILKNGNNGG